MIIDCHTHLPAVGDETGRAEHVSAAQAVDACFVFANSDISSEQANRDLAEYVCGYPNRMIGFGTINPAEDSISGKDIEQIIEKFSLRGFVLYCSIKGFHPTHSQAMIFYETIEKLKLPIFFHNSAYDLNSTSILQYNQPFVLDEIARTFPQLKIIISNMGIPFVDQALIMIAKHPNVYLDATIKPNNIWQTYNFLISAHEQGVMEKMLFGSGFPQANAGECIEALLGLNMIMGDTKLPTIPRVAIKSIIERNSLELLGIEHEAIKSRENKGQVLTQAKRGL